jgi:hypothetical protein
MRWPFVNLNFDVTIIPVTKLVKVEIADKQRQPRSSERPKFTGQHHSARKHRRRPAPFFAGRGLRKGFWQPSQNDTAKSATFVILNGAQRSEESHRLQFRKGSFFRKASPIVNGSRSRRHSIRRLA